MPKTSIHASRTAKEKRFIQQTPIISKHSPAIPLAGRRMLSWRMSRQQTQAHLLPLLLVPVAGLEPARLLQRGILSPICLPFHHTGIPGQRKTKALSIDIIGAGAIFRKIESMLAQPRTGARLHSICVIVEISLYQHHRCPLVSTARGQVAQGSKQIGEPSGGGALRHHIAHQILVLGLDVL